MSCVSSLVEFHSAVVVFQPICFVTVCVVLFSNGVIFGFEIALPRMSRVGSVGKLYGAVVVAQIHCVHGGAVVLVPKINILVIERSILVIEITRPRITRVGLIVESHRAVVLTQFQCSVGGVVILVRKSYVFAVKIVRVGISRIGLVVESH